MQKCIYGFFNRKSNIFGIYQRYSKFGTFNHLGTLSRDSLAEYNNHKVITIMAKGNWDEALIMIQKMKILDHSINKATFCYESIIYLLGYHREDKALECMEILNKKFLLTKTESDFIWSMVQIVKSVQESRDHSLEQNHLEALLLSIDNWI